MFLTRTNLKGIKREMYISPSVNSSRRKCSILRTKKIHTDVFWLFFYILCVNPYTVFNSVLSKSMSTQNFKK